MSPMQFAKAINEGRPIKVFNHGKHRQDFTYIDDIVGGVVASLERVASAYLSWSGLIQTQPHQKPPGGSITSGTTGPWRIFIFIGCLETALGKTTEKELLPKQPGDVENTSADISRPEADIGYSPNTPIEADVERFVAWFTKYCEVS